LRAFPPVNIVIRTIPHDQQRYPTVGDWWTDPDGTWQIRVSDMQNHNFELLVAFHELIEMAQCVQNGVSEASVTEFDKQFVPKAWCREPGDDMSAPYYHEHQAACGFERMLAALLGVNWALYEEIVDSL
jgi:hypothetical protein